MEVLAFYLLELAECKEKSTNQISAKELLLGDQKLEWGTVKLMEETSQG